jgi:hypothetical protein
MLPLFRIFLLSLLFLGCSVQQPSLLIVKERVTSLEKLLLTLDSKVDSQEAKDLAQASVAYSYELSKQYVAVSNPWFQNMLVNIGLKKRGLCHEWAEDLLKFLVLRKYQTLEFHTVGANIGAMNEHNALSVSAKGRGIAQSILLDAWRNSGILYFNSINKDLKYKWRERFNLYGVLPPKSGKR